MKADLLFFSALPDIRNRIAWFEFSQTLPRLSFLEQQYRLDDEKGALEE
jgi:hypothetical protein